jgi:hypothetical protein
MIGEEKVTLNVTVKIEKSQVLNFEYWLSEQIEVLSFKIVPNTEKLYEKNPIFKKLVKNVKEAQRVRDEFINDFNNE